MMVFCGATAISANDKSSGNPVFEGWYADPEGVVFGDEYWIYPTYSAPYNEQLFADAFSSPDLVHWTKHKSVLAIENISWLNRCLWAPSVVHANGKYYFFFGGNDIQNNDMVGGIGVAIADNPAGPFVDALGHPLIGEIVNGAQPIDQFVFRDDDGQYYMFYGGWRHCNVVRLSPDLLSVFLVVATQAKGCVLIHQKMFESRLFFVDKLIDMGAQIILCDPHRASVIGSGKLGSLRAANMVSPDIRAGIAMLIAAMSARGTSRIDNIDQIDRGYQNIDTRLNAIGANIIRI